MHEHDSIRDGTNVRQRVADGGDWDLFFAQFTDRENFRLREMKRDSMRSTRYFCAGAFVVLMCGVVPPRGLRCSTLLIIEVISSPFLGVVALELRCLQILRLGAG
jgi:hypothetical protein